jgi:hypothetical protein
MREEARAALKLKRELWRARQAGHQGADVELVAADAMAIAAATEWRLFRPSLKRGTQTRPVPVGGRGLT